MTDSLKVCTDGYAHSWTGDRSLYCEKCGEIGRARAVRDAEKSAGRTQKDARKKGRRQRQQRNDERAAAIDAVMASVTKALGEPPTVWYEDGEWVVEGWGRAGDLVQFRALKLSAALHAAIWTPT